MKYILKENFFDTFDEIHKSRYHLILSTEYSKSVEYITDKLFEVTDIPKSNSDFYCIFVVGDRFYNNMLGIKHSSHLQITIN